MTLFLAELTVFVVRAVGVVVSKVVLVLSLSCLILKVLVGWSGRCSPIVAVIIFSIVIIRWILWFRGVSCVVHVAPKWANFMIRCYYSSKGKNEKNL